MRFYYRMVLQSKKARYARLVCKLIDAGESVTSAEHGREVRELSDEITELEGILGI
jgi:hypothetical protein